MTPIRSGGVIAAGAGSRLAGLGAPKPLVEIAGVPLIAHVLSNLQAAGVSSAAVIFNDDEEDCAAFVRDRFGALVPTVIVKTTASSLESFREILAAAPAGRLLVSTVDAYCPRPDFLRFAREAAAAGDDETVLAVTRFVDDERPLWIARDGADRVTAVGGDSGDAVTAGIYVVPERLRHAGGLPEAPGGRLRDLLAALHASGAPMRAVEIPKVVDVDRSEDVEAAEGLARERAGGRG